MGANGEENSDDHTSNGADKAKNKKILEEKRMSSNQANNTRVPEV